MAYEDFQDLTRITASDKVLHDKAFNIANPRYDGYQSGLVSMVYNFLIKNSQTEQLKNENIWGADLADKQLTSKFNPNLSGRGEG